MTYLEASLQFSWQCQWLVPTWFVFASPVHQHDDAHYDDDDNGDDDHEDDDDDDDDGVDDQQQDHLLIFGRFRADWLLHLLHWHWHWGNLR